MNVASKELCQELYQLSKWGNSFSDLSELHYYWKCTTHNAEVLPFTMDVVFGDFYGRLLHTMPAYDLIYLLRQMPGAIQPGNAPNWLTIVKLSRGGFIAHYDCLKSPRQQEADTPEDAVCKLAIELFKQGLLTRDGETNA